MKKRIKTLVLSVVSAFSVFIAGTTQAVTVAVLDTGLNPNESWANRAEWDYDYDWVNGDVCVDTTETELGCYNDSHYFSFYRKTHNFYYWRNPNTKDSFRVSGRCAPFEDHEASSSGRNQEWRMADSAH